MTESDGLLDQRGPSFYSRWKKWCLAGIALLDAVFLALIGSEAGLSARTDLSQYLAVWAVQLLSTALFAWLLGRKYGSRVWGAIGGILLGALVIYLFHFFWFDAGQYWLELTQAPSPSRLDAWFGLIPPFAVSLVVAWFAVRPSLDGRAGRFAHWDKKIWSFVTNPLLTGKPALITFLTTTAALWILAFLALVPLILCPVHPPKLGMDERCGNCRGYYQPNRVPILRVSLWKFANQKLMEEQLGATSH